MVIADHLNEVPPGEWRYTTWPVLRDLSLGGYEIASHSLNHPDLTQLPVGDTISPGTATYEIYRSREKINEKITSQKCFTFAYPVSAYNDTVRTITSYYYQAARGSGTDHNGNNLNDEELMSIKSIAPLFDSPRNTIEDDIPELNSFKTLVDTSIQNGGWILSMLHEVVPQSELPSILNLWNPISTEWLNMLAGWLYQKSEAGDLWVTTLKNAASYIKERSTFSSEVISQTDTEIRISVSDAVNDSVYNYPLTADITVPGNWSSVRVIQGSRNSIAVPFQSGGEYYIRTKVVPDRGELILLKQDAAGNFSILGNIKYYQSAKPVADAVVIAKGINNFQASGVTDSQGVFSIDNIPPGSYSITFNKTGEFTGVNATDALLILRSTAGSINFDLIQRKAADVDKSSIIDTVDADLILKRFTHLVDHFESNDWLFFPENQEVTIIDQNITFDAIAIKAGDVSP